MNRILTLILALGLLGSAGCSTTEFTSTWKDPDVGPVSFAGKNVAAILMTTEEPIRREAEDLLAADLKARGVEGVAGYSIIPAADTKDSKKALGLLKDAGIEGVVAMRVVGVEQEARMQPSSWSGPYSSFSGYYGYGYSSLGMPTTFNIYCVETLIYDLKTDKLLWAGKSETFEPTSMKRFVREVVAEAAKVMKKQGLIGPASVKK